LFQVCNLLHWPLDSLTLAALIECYFDHRKKSWLVLWEAGIAVELPPWVAFVYPSSLLLHFNIDVDGKSSHSQQAELLHISYKDFDFVITDGNPPTKENSRPLGGAGDEGRGSLVYYNQASMYHGPETGFDTLDAARKSGQTGTVSSMEHARLAFPQHFKLASASSLLSGI